MSDRADQLTALAEELELDAVVLGLPANVLWLSGFDMVGTFYFTAVLAAGGDPALLVHRAELDMARAEARLSDVVPWGHGEDHVEALARWLEARVGSLRGRRVGVELDEWLRPRDLDEIAARTGLRWVDVGPRVEALRARLGPAELRASADAGRVADMTVAAGAAAVRAGASEHEIAAAALRTYVLAGGQEQPVPLSVRSGPRLALARGLPSERTLREGDAVCIEAWASLRRNAAVAAATVVVGTPSAATLQAWRAIESVFDAFETDPSFAEPAARAAGVELRAPLAFGLAFPYPLRPTIRWSPGTPHAAGQVVCVSPDAPGAAVAARTYAVGDDGLEPLTHRPQLWSVSA